MTRSKHHTTAQGPVFPDHREVIAADAEAAWQAVQRELFARHGG